MSELDRDTVLKYLAEHAKSQRLTKSPYTLLGQFAPESTTASRNRLIDGLKRQAILTHNGKRGKDSRWRFNPPTPAVGEPTAQEPETESGVQPAAAPAPSGNKLAAIAASIKEDAQSNQTRAILLDEEARLRELILNQVLPLFRNADEVKRVVQILGEYFPV